jgi:DNA-binding NtrC family response regulator
MARHFESEATVPLPDRLSVRGGRIESGGRTLEVGVERQRIGRARECALVLDDATVSAIHAEVVATPTGARLLDLGSRNGVFVGEARVLEAHLQGPCEFRCGDRRLRFFPDAPRDILVDGKTHFGSLTGRTPEMLSLFATLERFAPSSLSIVIHGETGTGKERVARAIHEASPRRKKGFLAINCAAMPDSLLEDELFGHTKGAFTGADRERAGLFVEANEGTLFFDEVGEMSPAMQAKLLRVLESGEVRPMGSERTRKVDVRTLFATHADLGEAVNKKRFREDLYFRIAQITVEIPPLRRRLEDLPLLLDDILTELGQADVAIEDATLSLLLARSWPGNVRELRSLIKVSLIGSPGGVLRLHDGRPIALPIESAAFETMSYDDAKKEFRRRYYTGLYAACRGNVTQIAKRAGKQRPTVREALREAQLDAGTDDASGAEPGGHPERGFGRAPPWRKSQ